MWPRLDPRSDLMKSNPKKFRRGHRVCISLKPFAIMHRNIRSDPVSRRNIPPFIFNWFSSSRCRKLFRMHRRSCTWPAMIFLLAGVSKRPNISWTYVSFRIGSVQHTKCAFWCFLCAISRWTYCDCVSRRRLSFRVALPEFELSIYF